MTVAKIVKRDGRTVKFEASKIENAIYKAMAALQTGSREEAKRITRDVVEIINSRFSTKKPPRVEQVQDIVEAAMIRAGLSDVAKAYKLYRKHRAEARAVRKKLGLPEADELKLSANAIRVLERRYLLRDRNGRINETPKQLFQRVARAVAAADKKFGASQKQVGESTETFFEMMARREFMPNTPTLMNAGARSGMLSACFVIPVPDDLRGIFDGMKAAALIQQSGGGTGFSFSRLRPKGDIVGSTHGVASGPVSFMTIYDMATNVIKQGSARRGANMGILRVDHPDILEFITLKSSPDVLTNFNISVGATDAFMQAVAKNEDYWLVNPRNKQRVKKLNARQVFKLIASQAWKTGDPGMIWLDEMNRRNPTNHIGEIESTNPCGEQILHPWESCNLGSINLAKMIRKDRSDVDWVRLGVAIFRAVHFLDNVIEVNKFPLEEITKITRANRRIGLGVMGFAEMLVLLGIPYDSPKALALAEQIAKYLRDNAVQASQKLAEKRGSFPNFKGSLWQKSGMKAMRNATVLTIAPTGTISIIAGCSSGIEPLFAVSFVRNVMEGTKLLEVNPVFEKIARERGFHSDALMEKIAKTGSVHGMREVPRDVQKLFVTALEIPVEQHVKMQSVWQKHVDNAVSKTINLPANSSPADVEKAYLLAFKLKCKGITVYRYGSKPDQVLTIGGVGEKAVEAQPEYAGGCVAPVCVH
ncbi:MAG TPA: adenosylcobalamin-dependent ribonucleoside-diphosphate reductase [Candidatus Norongarragalinales archaeon]|jgi:ribonucleoside-diphosphate reductase alpha chain|nr:adenosylcobalamin-dependent ribonucleoside-diphosphate reductase [Candidatus Norongarragalinales archaeon]